MIKYTETHEWVQLADEKATVGLSTLAQEQLGEVVHLELPKIGSFVHAGDLIAVLESTKAAVDLYAPLSGRIIAINEEVRQDPSLLTQDPEGKGWLFVIAYDNPEETESLLDAKAYQKQFE